MSIADQITRIKNNIAASYAECSAKGATLPSVENSENLPNTIASISSGTTINNQNKTFTENGTYTADAGYTGLGTVTVNVSGGSGDEVNYTNLTNADIKANDKLWINQTATTTTVADAQLPSFGYKTLRCLQTPNPNIVLASDNQVYTLEGNTYIGSSDGYPFQNQLQTDKYGNFISESSTTYIYNFNSGNKAEISGYYMGNGYVRYSSSTLRKYNTTTLELEQTYTGSGSNLEYGWSFEDGYAISSKPYNGLIYSVKFNDNNNTFTVKSLQVTSITPIGQLTDENIAFGLGGNSSYSLNLVAYKYSRTGDTLDDITFTQIPSSEFPDDMQPFFTEDPANIYWNEYSKILSGIWVSPTRILIFKYENGEWVNKTPVIDIDLSTSSAQNLNLTTSIDLSKIMISWLSGRTIYDGNEAAAGYYAVPYLYSRKESLVGKAQSDVAIDQTGKATTVLFGSSGSEVNPEPPAPDTPTIDPKTLKFGDRIDNKATVVGTFESSDFTAVFAVLDAQYRGEDIKCASDFGIGSGTSVGHDFDLPTYDPSQALNAKESATYNTNTIVYNLGDKAIEAYTFVRSIQPLNYNGTSYKCQLPTAYELQQIYNKRNELYALDPTAESNTKEKLSDWKFGEMNGAWSSTSNGVGKSLVLWNDGSWLAEDRNLIRGVIPIIEIPISDSGSDQDNTGDSGIGMDGNGMDGNGMDDTC